MGNWTRQALIPGIPGMPSVPDFPGRPRGPIDPSKRTIKETLINLSFNIFLTLYFILFIKEIVYLKI